MKAVIKRRLRTGLLPSLLLVMALSAAPSVGVSAAEPEPDRAQTAETDAAREKTPVSALRSIFSAKYYADQNPDLKAVYGYDEEWLFRHFAYYGLDEGRVASPVLDVRAYCEANPDLKAAYGSHWRAYVEHFVNYGIYECAGGTRSSEGVLFDPVAFLKENPDARLAAGGNLLKAVEYYIRQDMPVGKWTDATVAEALGVPVKPGTPAPVPAPDPEPETEPAPDPETDPAPAPEPVYTPDPVPECAIDHARLRCGARCSACDYTPQHDFSNGAPRCLRCGFPLYQATCPHDFSGGTCKKCGMADPSYCNYGGHNTYHVGQLCPGCNREGGTPHTFVDGVCSCGFKEGDKAEFTPEECLAAGGHLFNADGYCIRCDASMGVVDDPDKKNEDNQAGQRDDAAPVLPEAEENTAASGDTIISDEAAAVIEDAEADGDTEPEADAATNGAADVNENAESDEEADAGESAGSNVPADGEAAADNAGAPGNIPENDAIDTSTAADAVEDIPDDMAEDSTSETINE